MRCCKTVLASFTLMLAGGLACAADYYVDSDAGDDARDGRSAATAWKTVGRVNAAAIRPGDTVRFRRGGLWRGTLKSHSGAPGHPVVYAAYGKGRKPILQNSVERSRPEDWAEVKGIGEGRFWATRQDAPIACDVGIFIANHGERWGRKRWFRPNWEGVQTTRWKGTNELSADLDYWYEPDAKRVVVKCPKNPGEAFASIELALTGHVVNEENCHDVTYDGLWMRYGAAHGFGGGGVSGIVIRNCDICWIGGGLQYWKTQKDGLEYPVRYGNGIEFWNNCRNCLVERCRIWEIYDAAVTNQGRESDEFDVVWRDNVIWNSEYSYEYWNRGRTGNVLFEHNTCVDAGHGWAHTQRPDANGAHLMYYSNRAATTNFVVRDNIFCRATEWTARSDNGWLEGLLHDHNLVYNDGDVPVMRWLAGKRLRLCSWQEYLGLGFDPNGRFAEPKFRNPAKRDYRLAPDSPGLTLSHDGTPVGARNMPGLDADTSALAADLTEAVSADIVLSEGWRAKSDVRHEGLTNGWATAEPEGTTAVRMPLDGRTVAPNVGELWLYNEFVPDAPAGSRVFLECARQQYLTTVWLNGCRLGEHRGSCDRFSFDLTGLVRNGETNRLVMNLRSPSGAFRVDGNSSREMPVWGGAPRVQEAPVVRTHGPAAIVDVATHPDLRTGRLTLEVELDAAAAGSVDLSFEVRENGRAAVLQTLRQTVRAEAGRSVHRIPFPQPIPNFRAWSPDDPTYYRVTVRAPGEEVVAKAGFRELRVDGSGYFELNGRRIFLKSAHMCNYVPFASDIPAQLPRLYQTLLYLKVCGFNAIRYLLQPAHPELIDLCDDIGLMVYEEHPMSWQRRAGVQACELFRNSTTSIVRRDRNHPSFAAFGLMNETESVPEKMPFIETARDLLPELRTIDRDVLFLFDSGRWDRRLDQASAANPQSSVWDGWMGDEGEGQALPPLPEKAKPWHNLFGLGDFHQYPHHPLGTKTRTDFDRILSGRRRAVFVSESGMGSAVNIVHEYLRYDQDGVFRDGDYELAKRQVAQFRRGFERYGLYSVWPTPEAMIQASQEFNSAQRGRLTTMIRRHPEASGYSVTMAQDLGLRGEGLLETSGSFKRGTTDMLEEAMADLRFCLTASNETVYAGTDLDLEIALSDFGVLKPGRTYPIALRIAGPDGIVWRRELSVCATACPVTNLFSGKVGTSGWRAGRYALGAEILEGAHAECGTLDLTLVDPNPFGELKGRTVYSVNGVHPNVHGFLKRVGMKLVSTKIEDVPEGAAVFVGYRKLSDESRAKLMAVARAGGLVMFLQPEALAANKEEPRGLPLAERGKLKWTGNWLYHADSVVLESPLTADVPARGILDQRFFGAAWGDAGFHGITPPDVPGIVSAYVGKGDKPGETECDVSVQLGAYRVGRGWMVLNTLRLDLGGGTPCADLLLRNMMRLGI